MCGVCLVKYAETVSDLSEWSSVCGVCLVKYAETVSDLSEWS